MRQYHPASGIVSKLIQDEMILVHLQTNKIFILNSTGARIWELLTAGRSLPDILAILQQEFEGDPQQITDDLNAQLDRLVEESLLKID